jgi:uncharacterized protein YggE
MPTEPAEAGSDATTPTVTVRGEAVLRSEPDEAIVWITLSALRDAPGPALQDVAHRSEALSAMLEELDVARPDRTTTGVSVYEEFDHTPRGRRSLGHRAVARIALRVSEPAVIGRLVTSATTELDARVDGPRWQIAADNPVRLEAARAAAANGRRKAQAYAEGVGARLGGLLKLAEPEHQAFVRTGGLRPLAAAAEPSMPIEPGEHEVAAAIYVTFALEPSAT